MSIVPPPPHPQGKPTFGIAHFRQGTLTLPHHTRTHLTQAPICWHGGSRYFSVSVTSVWLVLILNLRAQASAFFRTLHFLSPSFYCTKLVVVFRLFKVLFSHPHLSITASRRALHGYHGSVLLLHRQDGPATLPICQVSVDA